MRWILIANVLCLFKSTPTEESPEREVCVAVLESVTGEGWRWNTETARGWATDGDDARMAARVAAGPTTW